MKKTFFVTIISVFTLLYGCKEETIEVITTSRDAFDVTTLNSSEVLTVSATCNWYAKSSANWCTMSDSVGTTSKVILLTCQTNVTGLPREANITVYANKQTKTIRVSQSGGSVLFADDFNDDSNDWSGQSDSVSSTIGGGNLTLKCWSKRYYYQHKSKSIVPDYSSDYIVLVNYTDISKNNSFSFILGYKDNANHYRVYVNYNGVYALTQYNGGVYSIIKSGLTTCVKAQNTVAVVKKGSVAYLYINDHKMCTFDYNPQSSDIRFLSYPQTEFAINRLMVNQL